MNNDVNVNNSVYQSQDNNLNMYKLTLTRKKAYVLSLETFKIFIDNVMVAKIKNGQTIVLDVTPGVHTISINNNNPITINIDRDTTAEIVMNGAYNFVITNINGSGYDDVISDSNNSVSKHQKETNVLLIGSIVLPIISLVLYFLTNHKYVLQFGFYALLVSVSIINISSINSLKKVDESLDDTLYKSLLIKSIITIVIGITCIAITIYITNI